jgi:cell division protein FtsB
MEFVTPLGCVAATGTPMDTQYLLNIFFGLFSGVTGWFAREMWSAVKELKADLAKLREELPKQYAAKEDFKDGIRELKDMLNKIFDRLENKQDK